MFCFAFQSPSPSLKQPFCCLHFPVHTYLAVPFTVFFCCCCFPLMLTLTASPHAEHLTFSFNIHSVLCPRSSSRSTAAEPYVSFLCCFFSPLLLLPLLSLSLFFFVVFFVCFFLFLSLTLARQDIPSQRYSRPKHSRRCTHNTALHPVSQHNYRCGGERWPSR